MCRSCFVTTFRRNWENELPSDSEQYPPFALAERSTHGEPPVACTKPRVATFVFTAVGASHDLLAAGVFVAGRAEIADGHALHT